ncbi:MAG TPA: RNA polymerase factor sigma-54 [Planctomycetota bacterium]|nr:RNA polymerase factor sigma-54 [Planctomycetota bacterium]
MKLELSQSLQQQQILAPQMILSMDILLLSSLDLEQRVRQEFAENPALEIVERERTPSDAAREVERRSDEPSFSRLESFRDPSSSWTEGPRRRSYSESDAKHEALQNTEGKPPGLRDYLTQQVHLRGLSERVAEASEEIINNLDHRGYLLCSVDELRETLSSEFDPETFEAAFAAVRDLDPAGVGAENLQDCLLLQLERDAQDYSLEREIILRHLQDLGQNKLPKIARDIGRSVEEIKEAVEIISCLDPFPGRHLESEPTIYIRPDVWVDVVDGEIEVRVDAGNLPELQVSDACRNLLKAHRGNREITDFVRKKIESAQWLIQAIHQRQRTLHDIAVAVAEFQREFMIHGPEHLKALKMQTIADMVRVHLSTISRAIKGKHMQTPHGLFEMRYFFTGGVENEDGEVESRRNVCRMIEELVEAEDKSKPLSDSALTRLLKERGLQIARRTVTKYREQQGIPSSRLRKTY